MIPAAVDVVGVGLNATDTMLVVPHFPAYGGKVPFLSEEYSPGGQVATAMVACAKLGLRTKYIGTIGDDERGRIQMESLRDSGINLDHVQQRHNCPNQSAYIVIDQSTGERTVFWSRPDCLRITPEEITPEQITCARLLHVDGHDTAAVEHAARIARARMAFPCPTVDVDTIYPGFERVLPLVDYLIASSEFPARWTRVEDPFQALAAIQDEYWHGESGGDDARRARRRLRVPGKGAIFTRRASWSIAWISPNRRPETCFTGRSCYSVLQKRCLSPEAPGGSPTPWRRPELYGSRRARSHRRVLMKFGN